MKYLLFTICFLFPVTTFAASAVIEIDTGSNSINALEGTVIVPKGMKVNEIRTGDSMILFWITHPILSGDARTINFAGLTPGGFRGKQAVFTIVGDFKQGEEKLITFSGVRSLRNDGLGTEVKIKLSVLSGQEATDTISPEPFPIAISRSEDMFDGKPFLSFATQDKGTGVVKYEAAESLILSPSDSSWSEIESPYEVRDRYLLKKAYVRAIDHAGNMRTEKIALPNRRYVIGFLVILISVPCIVVARRSRKRYSQ